jgi:hypothetical protein
MAMLKQKIFIAATSSDIKTFFFIVIKILIYFFRSHLYRPLADWGLLCDARCTVLLAV